MKQKEFIGKGSILKLNDILSEIKPKNIFLVTGRSSYSTSGAKNILDKLLETYNVVQFNDFETNPKFEEVIKGIHMYRRKNFDLVIAVGGGSVMDVAKLINIFAANPGKPEDYIKKEIEITKKGKPLVAIPTTSGSGSEATHFAVVYIDGIKYSLSHEFILPDWCIVDSNLAMSMPANVAAASGMDALSQAIESYWSVNSTLESKKHSEAALKLIMGNLIQSINIPSVKSRDAMAKGAFLAGKALNIAKTTAPHALSYMMTSQLGLAHGHAVGLTLGPVLEYNANVSEDDCNDNRGSKYVRNIINQIISLLGVKTPEQAKTKIKTLMKQIHLETDTKKLGISNKTIEMIIENVNIERLKNNPRKFPDKESIRKIINKI